MELKDFTKTVHKNSVGNILLRGFGILCGLVFTRVNLSYLGDSLYGLWATIASISAWANFGDLGISNGLRNELTKAIAEENFEKQKNLIKTAVTMLSRISLVIFVILTAVSETFFALDIMDSSLRAPMYITNAFFCVSFILGISRTVAYSYQKSWLASLAQTSTMILQILGVLLLIQLSVPASLIPFAIVNGVGSILGNVIIILCIIGFINRTIPKEVKGRYDAAQKHSILNIGLRFFVLQLCCLVLYTTDNVIINKLFDSAQVAKYSIITTIYNTGDSLFALLLISLWSAVTYATAKGEYSWIGKEIKNLIKFWGVYTAGVIAVSVLLNWIVKIWLAENAFHYEPGLVFVFGLYASLNAFGAIFVNVTNGMGRINLQMVCSVIGAVINIPLSIILAKTCGMGLAGIKLATMICCLGSIAVIPIDVTRFLRSKKREEQ